MSRTTRSGINASQMRPGVAVFGRATLTASVARGPRADLRLALGSLTCATGPEATLIVSPGAAPKSIAWAAAR